MNLGLYEGGEGSANPDRGSARPTLNVAGTLSRRPPYQLRYTNGSVRLIGEGFEYQVIVDSPGNRECGCHTGAGNTTLTKVVAEVAGVFISALPASVSVAGSPSISPYRV